MEIGVNISNPYKISLEKEMNFQREVRGGKNMSRHKKIVPHPFQKGEKVPAWYRLGTIKILHLRFEAVTGVKCSLKSFRQNILF